MPRELLGDRAYHAALRRLGVKNPGDVPIGVPVNLTAKVDDLSHLAEPLGLETYAVGHDEAAVAAERSCFWLRAGRGGLWIEFIVVDHDVWLYRDDVLVITGATPVVPLPFSGAAAAALLGATAAGFHMTNANIGVPGAALYYNIPAASNTIIWPRPIYLGAGQRILIVGDTDNEDTEVGLMFIEVPSPGG